MKGLRALLAAAWMVSLLLPACAPARPDCESAEVFCVGLVTNTNRINDRAFNQSAWEGVQRAGQELGALVQYIETTDPRDYAKNISTFVEEQYDVIVTVGFALREATWEAAEANPRIRFIGVDQDQSEGAVDNVVGLVFPEDQAGFLVGALAAMMSDTHKVGAVCPTDEVPSVWRLGEGFRAGAEYADSLTGTNTDIFVVYNSDEGFDTTFIDPDWGEMTARAMMEEGADVIFGCGGSTGEAAMLAAAQSGFYAIGVDTDQYWTLPEAAPRMLSSAVKLITPGIFELLRAARENNVPSGNYYGHVSYAPYHDLEHEVPEEVKAAMQQINADLRGGAIETNVPLEKP
jgi:basic membrane protein A